MIETASLYDPLHRALVDLLRGLEPDDWMRPTVAGAWRVRDVAAHLLDGQLRRLSFHRDGHPMPPPPAGLPRDAGLVDLLDALNAEWIAATRRVSPRVLVDLLEVAGPALSRFVAKLDPEAPAFFPVDWAGSAPGPAWLDIGRDYTELWHHQAQIRDAVGAAPLYDRRLYHPVLALGARALVPALHGRGRTRGETVRWRVEGEAGGTWWFARGEGGRWRLLDAPPAADAPTAGVTWSADDAWRALFNALPPPEARRRADATGDPALVEAVLRARSVMVAPPHDDVEE